MLGLGVCAPCISIDDSWTKSRVSYGVYFISGVIEYVLYSTRQ